MIFVVVQVYCVQVECVDIDVYCFLGEVGGEGGSGGLVLFGFVLLVMFVVMVDVVIVEEQIEVVVFDKFFCCFLVIGYCLVCSCDVQCQQVNFFF